MSIRDRNFTLLQNGQTENTSGLDYNDYLQILLFTTSRHSLAFRCMDMIEQNIRLKPGKENFRIDSCMEGLEMETSLDVYKRQLLVCAKNMRKCIDKQNSHSLCFYLIKRIGKFKRSDLTWKISKKALPSLSAIHLLWNYACLLYTSRCV